MNLWNFRLQISAIQLSCKGGKHCILLQKLSKSQDVDAKTKKRILQKSKAVLHVQIIIIRCQLFEVIVVNRFN